MSACEQRCGSTATVYAMGRGAGDYGGRYCEACAHALRYVVTDRLTPAASLPEEPTRMKPGADILGRVWTQEEIDLRAQVCNRLHYTSSGGPLTDALWYGARMLADGFGDLTALPPSVAQECIGDWSHVRDSSPQAFRAMHVYLREQGAI